MSLLIQNEIYLMIIGLPFVSSMLYDFFQKGMIFEFYGNWLFKEDRHNEMVESNTLPPMDFTKGGLVTNEIIQDYGKIKETPFYKKPLGNCLKCFHIWVCIVFTLSYFLLNHLDLNLFKWITSVGISYFILIKKNYE